MSGVWSALLSVEVGVWRVEEGRAKGQQRRVPY
jgi:hypothetical protein